MRKRYKRTAIILSISLILALMPVVTAKADKPSPQVYTVTVDCNAPQDNTGAQPTLIDLGTFTVTAYTNSVADCGKTDGITKSGVKAVEGVTIAADWSVLPEGTQVEVDGHFYAVQDVGSKIKGNHIDIYFSSAKEVNEFGKQHLDVCVKEG